MQPILALAVMAAVLVAATLVGMVARATSGRVRRGSDHLVTDADVAAPAPFGRRATLVQFSTERCALCPGTARLLGELAGSRAGVVHLEVDLGRHPEVADRFGVLQTPTTLLVDGRRRLRARIGGAPDRTALARELDTVLGGIDVH